MVVALWITVLTPEDHTVDCVLSECQNSVIAVSRPVTLLHPIYVGTPPPIPCTLRRSLSIFFHTRKNSK